ncbi:MAG: Imm39 family immunity protein [Pirellula sp.]
MAKKHNRKLGLCAAAMTTMRVPNYDIAVATLVRDEIEQVMIDSDYLVGAPFEWVTISLRYGLQNEDQPHYEPVNKQYSDLPLAIELDTNELAKATREEMKRAFELATLKALVAAGKKFELSYKELETRLEAIMI